MINHVNCRISSFCFMMCLNRFFLSFHGTRNCYVLKPGRLVIASLKLCFVFYDNGLKNWLLLSKYVGLMCLNFSSHTERERESERIKGWSHSFDTGILLESISRRLECQKYRTIQLGLCLSIQYWFNNLAAY